ncbi:MAG: hypothetical protein M3N11_07930 [Actinomycetota bacterium]|nr:hypothetical protein [Actinomycetota bacterium]
MSDLNMPGDDGGIGGDVPPGEEEPAEEHGGDVGAGPNQDGGGDGDLGLGPALAPPD